MKSIKKLTATLLAVSSMTAVTASLNSAFAYEGLSLEEEHYVASFESDDAQCVAAYCLREGLSLAETQDMMADYVPLASEPAMARTVSAVPYYSRTNLSLGQHYIALIHTNPSAGINERVRFNFTPSKAVYGDAASECWDFGATYIIANTNSNYDMCDLQVYIPNCSETGPVAIAKVAVDVTGATSENQIKASIGMSDFYANGNLTFETYVLGDVNHNGIVNSYDKDCLLRYLAGCSDYLDINYSDAAYHYVDLVAQLASNVDGDNMVSLSDAVEIRRYYE